MNENAGTANGPQAHTTGTVRAAGASRATRRRRRSDVVHVVAGALSPKLHAAWRALGLPALQEHASAAAPTSSTESLTTRTTRADRAARDALARGAIGARRPRGE